jgi:hypothetical protein
MSRAHLLVVATVLFVALTPGILFTILRRGPRLHTAIAHGAVFALTMFAMIQSGAVEPFSTRIEAAPGAAPGSVKLSMKLNEKPVEMTLSSDASNSVVLTGDSALLADIVANPARYFGDASGATVDASAGTSIFSDSSAATVPSYSFF